MMIFLTVTSNFTILKKQLGVGITWWMWPSFHTLLTPSPSLSTVYQGQITSLLCSFPGPSTDHCHTSTGGIFTNIWILYSSHFNLTILKTKQNQVPLPGSYSPAELLSLWPSQSALPEYTPPPSTIHQHASWVKFSTKSSTFQPSSFQPCLSSVRSRQLGCTT